MSIVTPFRKFNDVVGKILVKASPDNPKVPTMLMRVIGRDNEQLHLTLVGKASLAASKLVEGRVYSFRVPGKIVAARKYNRDGMRCDLQVRAQYPLAIELCTHSFVHAVRYDLTPFADLHQKSIQDFVDVYGTVTRLVQDLSQNAASLAKKEVALVSGEYEVLLELLGPKASLQIREGDRLAVKDCKVQEWNYQRKLSTSFLTYVEVNPAVNETLSLVSPADEGSPKKKAMLSASLPQLTAPAVLNMKRELLQGNEKQREFCFSGRVRRLQDSVFTQQIFYGSDDNIKIKIIATLFDDNAELDDVILWHDAVRDVFHVDGAVVVAAWYKCDTRTGKDSFLKMLSESLDQRFHFFCKASVWEYGRDGKTKIVQVLVNSARSLDA